MATMSVVKALKPKRAWGQVAYTDRYLRGCLPEQIREGIHKTDPLLYDGLNCERDTFTKTLQMNMKWHGEKKVKAYEYVQSFSRDDSRTRLTPELAHQLGLEFANRFFPDVPCLVVTHTDRKHLHNQFLIGNVNITTGKCLQLNARSLREMKLFSGEQCRRHGLTSSVFEEGKKKGSPKRSDAEHLMKSQGKVPVKDQLYEQIRSAISSPEVDSFEEFLKLLSGKHGIICRVSGNTISFKHPDLSRPVRGTRLAADLTRDGIEMGISLAVHERSSIIPATPEEKPALILSSHTEPSRENELKAVDTAESTVELSKPDDSTVADSLPLSHMQLEKCREELMELVQERRSIKAKLQAVLDMVRNLREKLANLKANIAFWKKEKKQKEELLKTELGETEAVRTFSRSRSR